MNILALETSMGACSAAVLCVESAPASGAPAAKLFARLERMERGHAEALLPMAAAAMAEAGLDFAALDLIAATTGPGSFTGVRIAISAARGLALATGAKLYGIDSLSVMARAAREKGVAPGAPLAIAADARRGMLYAGLYDAAGKTRQGPLLLAPEEAASMLPADLHVAVGSGATLLAEAAARRGQRIEATLPELQPDAASLALLAFERGETAEILRPLYLRPPDAKPQAQQVARR